VAGCSSPIFPEPELYILKSCSSSDMLFRRIAEIAPHDKTLAPSMWLSKIPMSWSIQPLTKHRDAQCLTSWLNLFWPAREYKEYGHLLLQSWNQRSHHSTNCPLFSLPLILTFQKLGKRSLSLHEGLLPANLKQRVEFLCSTCTAPIKITCFTLLSGTSKLHSLPLPTTPDLTNTLRNNGLPKSISKTTLCLCRLLLRYHPSIKVINLKYCEALSSALVIPFCFSACKKFPFIYQTKPRPLS
jgi:hypothetical protein